jgi:cytoskeleton protein RodZ
MTIITALDEQENVALVSPGEQLMTARRALRYSPELVASKLYLRVQVIELLEANDYEKLPEAVFVTGYMRAYAKLLDINPEPVIAAYYAQFYKEKKLNRPLWQSRRNTHYVEHALKWLTIGFSIFVLVAVAVWWQKAKEGETLISEAVSESKPAQEQAEGEVKVMDLSKMRSLLSPDLQSKWSEEQGRD